MAAAGSPDGRHDLLHDMCPVEAALLATLLAWGLLLVLSACSPYR